MKRTIVLARFALLVCLLIVPPTGWPAQRDEAPVLDALTARSLGPANMSGRICDLAVADSNPALLYVASASGGLWKSTDAGVNFAPVFDGPTTSTIGAVAVARSNPDVVWLGTGEANARNSVSWGDGVYRSTDGAKTWQHMGLKETQHIGRIVIHPQNPEIVYVAALGRLWGPNKERGLYKTSNAGKTWELVKYIDENTGFIDVAMDPEQPDTLYATAYCVRRDAFSGGNPAVQIGPGAGLFKTVDGGKTWSKMTKGLPRRPLGRCGLDVCHKDPRIVYAVVQTDKTSVTVQGQGPNLQRRIFKNEFGQKVVENMTADHGGVFRSDDRGETWVRVNSLCPRPFYYGQIRVDPNDANRIYVLGIGFHVSKDGGRTFATPIKGKGVHPDHHALWINPKNSDELLLGNDGGLYFSQNRGASWQHSKKLPVSQFYAIAVDMRKPYRVYGGLQDNGSWGGASATRNREGIGLSDWYKVLAADGFHCQVDPTDYNLVYAEGQYGRPYRIDLRKGKGRPLQPQADQGDPAYRFNWSAPLLLSPHNPRTLYFGGNHVFRSDYRGDAWQVISPDLTHGEPGPSKSTGHTLTTLAESPLKAGLLWAGSDDGRIHLSRNGGRSWAEVSKNVPGLPRDRWISRLECSHFAEGTAYLAVDRHRNDDRKPYLFRTTDYGKTWIPLAKGLPDDGPVYVVRESSRNKELLFVGTEHALFASLDGGARWQRLANGLPTVPVHDLVIHPRDRDLVIGTHGRGIYVMDVGPLEELTPKALAAAAHLCNIRPAVAFKQRSSPYAGDAAGYRGANPPFGAVIWFHLRREPAQAPAVTILDREGTRVASIVGEKRAGLQRVVWPLRSGNGAALAAAGDYVVRLQAGDVSLTKTIRVEAEE